MDEIRRIVGGRLRQARVEAGLTQQALAQELGLSQVGYSGMERGRSLIRVDVLLDVCAVLGRPVTYFVGVGSAGIGDVSDESREVVGRMESMSRREREAVLWYARFVQEQGAKEFE